MSITMHWIFVVPIERGCILYKWLPYEVMLAIDGSLDVKLLFMLLGIKPIIPASPMFIDDPFSAGDVIISFISEFV